MDRVHRCRACGGRGVILVVENESIGLFSVVGRALGVPVPSTDAHQVDIPGLRLTSISWPAGAARSRLVHLLFHVEHPCHRPEPPFAAGLHRFHVEQGDRVMNLRRGVAWRAVRCAVGTCPSRAPSVAGPGSRIPGAPVPTVPTPGWRAKRPAIARPPPRFRGSETTTQPSTSSSGAAHSATTAGGPKERLTTP